MSITITHPEDTSRELRTGDSYRNSGAIDEADLDRARQAAAEVLAQAGVQPHRAQAAWREQWDEFDDEAPMTGAARVWIEARSAANTALTATWAKPVNLGIGLRV